MNAALAFLKRFYKDARAEAEDTGFSVLLDGKPVKTPAGKALLLPTKPLADFIAAEWQSQEEKINPDSMPFTQLAATVIDVLPRERTQIIAQLARAATTDVLCHREPELGALRTRQETLWQPHLDKLAATANIRLPVTDALVTGGLPQEIKARLEAVLQALSDWKLAGVDMAAGASSSVALSLLLEAQQITAADAFAAAELERHFHMEKWGVDEELNARLDSVRTDLDIVQRWFKLLG